MRWLCPRSERPHPAAKPGQIQPSYPPRPDLAELGIAYRRIPILAIGKDVYCDSRLILDKLEEVEGYGPKLGASTPEGLALERLFDKWTFDSGVFWEAVKLIPFWTIPEFQDPKFISDREELTGGTKLTEKELVGGRPEALTQIRSAFQLLESSILSDGRKWVLGDDNPTLADIHAIFPLQWMAGIEGSLPEQNVSAKIFPKTFAWIRHFWDTFEAARNSAPKPRRIEGSQAVSAIFSRQPFSQDMGVDEDDPLALKKGEIVEVKVPNFPEQYTDRGKLLSLKIDEIVIETSKGVPVHFPRWRFSVRKASAA